MRKPSSPFSPQTFIGALLISIAGTLVGTIAGVTILNMIGQNKFLASNPTIVLLILFLPVLIVTFIVAVLPASRAFFDVVGRFAQSILRWTKNNWQLVVGLTLLFGTALGSFIVTHSPWVIALTFGLACAVVLLAVWLFGFSARTKYTVEGEVRDLQQVFHNAIGLPISSERGRIFHTACPCVLPVCFKSPNRLEYTYVVVDTRVDHATNEDNSACIVTRPRLPDHNIRAVTVAGLARWYQLTSPKPLEWIRFRDGPRVETFLMVDAEIHPVQAWNQHTPVVVPRDQILVYALAVTEQIGSSTWFVSIDGCEYTFTRDLGCHFMEFILPKGQEHSLSLGYKEGGLGIACAFFAF